MLDQITEILDKARFRYFFRPSHRTLWDEVLQELPFIPVYYTNASIDYQLEYQQGQGGEWHDISLIIANEGVPIALWPLSYSMSNGLSQLTSHGLGVLPPIFMEECSFRSRKKITIQCLEFANRLAEKLLVGPWSSVEYCNDEIGLSPWHLASMKRGGLCRMQHALYVDLRMNMVDIKSRFRERYRSLITAGQRLWQVNVLAQPGDNDVWQEFRGLHLTVSGRVTRSEATWTLQHEEIRQGRAILVTLRDRDGRLVGGGLFNFTRDEGVYSVGAYDRTLFHKPLAHTAQFRAIQEMQKRDIKWYKIGIRYFDTGTPKPTAKEISISQFKDGFATHVFPIYNIVHAVPSA